MATLDEAGPCSEKPAQVASIESTTRSGSSAEDWSEIEEMRAVRQEQDALITRLMEDNAHLEASVVTLESSLCKLQAQLRRTPQTMAQCGATPTEAERTGLDDPDAGMDVSRVQSENGSEQQDAESVHADIVILKEHAHCTTETCWRQKYTESLGQLRAVLVELKSELEEKGIPEREADNPNTRRQSKVQLIEESIRTLDVKGQGDTPMERVTKRSRKRSLLGLDSSLRRVKLSRTSESQTSLTKAPLIKRMMNLFKKKPSSSLDASLTTK